MKIFKKFIPIVFLLFIVLLPVTVLAGPTLTPEIACGQSINNLGDLICKIGSLLKSLIPVLITLGIVYFIWGVVTFVINDEEEAKTKGRDRIIYGIIGFVVIFALWGLVNIAINTFGLEQGANSAADFIQNNEAILGDNFSGACDLSTISNPKIGDLLNYVTCLLIKSVIPLIIALAMAMFIWGVIQYVINSDEEAKKEKGRDFMIWGIIALTVMFSVWGLVRILGTTFGIEYAIPQLKQ